MVVSVRIQQRTGKVPEIFNVGHWLQVVEGQQQSLGALSVDDTIK